MRERKNDSIQVNGDLMEAIISRHKVIAILRNVPEKELQAYVESLYEGGIRAFEVSFTTEHAGNQIDYIKQKLPGDSSVGAGTVLNEREAREAEAAGADFMLSPSVCQKVMEYCAKQKIAYMPGVLTPSDVSLSLSYGFHVLKLFPSNVFSVSYRNSLKGPFPQAEFVAVGGVSLKNASEYLKNGFVGVGIGSSLVKEELLLGKRWEMVASDIKVQLERLRKEGLL